MFDTILTADWLKNNADLNLNLETLKENYIYKDYYLKVCQVIYNSFYLKLSFSEIEEYIQEGEYTYTDAKGNETKITCPITDKATREYLFLLAQAKQLRYEKLNGVGGMINDAMKQMYSTSPEVIEIIKQLGLYQRHFAVV